MGRLDEWTIPMILDERTLYREIGSRVRSARTAAGLTQRQLADRLGVERTSVTNIEAGEQKPPLHVLYRLCFALGVDLGVLLPPVDQVPWIAREEQLSDLELDTVPPKTAEVIRALLDEWPEEP